MGLNPITEWQNGLLVSFERPTPPSVAELAGEELSRRRSRLEALERERRGVERSVLPTDRHYPGGDPAALTPSARTEVEQAFQASRAGRLAAIDAELAHARQAVGEAAERYRQAVRDESSRRELQAGFERVEALPAGTAQPVQVEVEGRGIFGRMFG